MRTMGKMWEGRIETKKPPLRRLNQGLNGDDGDLLESGNGTCEKAVIGRPQKNLGLRRMR